VLIKSLESLRQTNNYSVIVTIWNICV